MTTLLPPSEVDMLRSLKGAAVFLLVMLRLDRVYPGRSFQPEQIASILDVDVRTVTKHLQSLSARNRVLLTATGYVLTEGGRAMFLSATENDLALSPGTGTQAQALTSPEQVSGTEVQASFSPGRCQAQTEDTSAAHPANFAENPAHNVCKSLKDSVVVNQDLNLNPKSSTTDSESRAQNVQPLDARVILEHTSMLFEKRVFAPREIDMLDAREVLGWVAQAYGTRKELHSPWGIVYWGLVKGQKCRAKYRISPADYLPVEYLQAIGYPVPNDHAPVNSEQGEQDEQPETGESSRYYANSFEAWLG